MTLHLPFRWGAGARQENLGGQRLKLKASLRTPIPATVVQMLQSVYYTLPHLIQCKHGGNGGKKSHF